MPKDADAVDARFMLPSREALDKEFGFAEPKPTAAPKPARVEPIEPRVGMVVEWAPSYMLSPDLLGPRVIRMVERGGDMFIVADLADGRPSSGPICAAADFSSHVAAGELRILSDNPGILAPPLPRDFAPMSDEELCRELGIRNNDSSGEGRKEK